jgi:hypothetical protein
VEAIVAGFGNDVDLATTEFPVLCIKIASNDAELGDRIKIRNDGCAGIHIFFGIAPVHTEVVGKLSLAVY